MEKEIRGQAVPATRVYVPSDDPERDEPQQGAPGTPWTDTAVAAASPGYAFTPEQLHSIAGKWETLAERYERAKLKAQIIALAEGPGAEYASINNADRVRASGRALLDALDQRARYCDDMAKKFRTAVGSYVAAEDTVAAEIESKEGKY